MRAAGRSCAARAPATRNDARRAASSTSRARCCAATAWCSGGCSSARRPGCRHGATCCACFAGWKARGEIRGGRFVAGFSGEQFALPDAVGAAARDAPAAGGGTLVSHLRRRSAQPRRHPHARPDGRRAHRHRLLYADGLPIALLAGGQVQFLRELEPAREWEAHKALLLAAETGASLVPRTGALAAERTLARGRVTTH